MTSKAVLTLLICAAGAAVFPGSALAEYYVTQRGAENRARDFVADRYDFSYGEVGAYCRPQGERRSDPRYKYHRWVCYWSTGDCEGVVQIIGSRGRGAYYGRVLRGMRCA